MEPGITKTQSIILGSGRSIYKQPIAKNRGSPHWYARVHMKIGSQYTHTRSTGTTDTKKAIKFAEEFYGQCLVTRNQPQLTTSPQVGGPTSGLVYRFDKIVDEWLNGKQGAGGGARAAKGFNEARKLCSAPNGPCAFFKRMDIRTIKTDAIRRYLAFAEEHSKRGQLAKTTQRNHLTTLSSIFKFAVERDYLAAVPMMPKLRLEDNPRPPFTRDEFARLCASAGALAKIAARNGKEMDSRDWMELHDFLIFMIATFLRAGEWKDLRQKHCRYVPGEHPHLLVTLPRAKTGQRIVVSMPEAVEAYRCIVHREGDDPERYLFRPRHPNRDTAHQFIRKRFDQLLKLTDLALDQVGKKRTLYSLRHTSLMLRLVEGDNVDLFMLARNAGTSLPMLQRFYLSRAHATMKVDNLHSLRAAKRNEEVMRPASSSRGNVDVTKGLTEPVEAVSHLEMEVEAALAGRQLGEHFTSYSITGSPPNAVSVSVPPSTS